MPRLPLPSTWRVQMVTGMHARCIGKVEDTPNRGQLPDYLQRGAGGTLGEYWCCDMACTTAADVLGKASPLILSGSCEQQRQRAIAKGARRTRSEFDVLRQHNPLLVAGWLFLCVGPDKQGNPHAHHTGVAGMLSAETGEIVVNGPRGGFLVCEGNAANPKGTASSNGDGAYHGRERGHPDDSTVYEFIALEAFPL